MPAGTVTPKEALFWQPEVLSEPPDYQSKYWCISLADPEFQFHEHRLISHIPQPERLRHVYIEGY
jgi:hypothetical protein